jgi:hypothetical protein
MTTFGAKEIVITKHDTKDGKGKHQHKNYGNIQLDTTFIPFQSTAAINQGTIIRIRIIVHNTGEPNKCMNYM